MMKMPLSLLRRCASTLVLSGSLCACATDPMVEWKTPEPVPTPMWTQDDALRLLDSASGEYKRVLREQTGNSRLLGNALIVGGALATGLAVAGVNRDGILGLGLLGGTAYALGGYNIDQRRWLVYQAAIEGFQCARKAAAPANMRVVDRKQLEAQLSSLGTRLAKIDNLVAEVAVQLRSQGNLDAAHLKAVQPLVARLDALKPAVAAARSAYDRGQGLLVAVDRTPALLVSAVNEIDNSARRALISTLPDRDAAIKSISEIATGAAGIAPGASVDKAFATGLTAYRGIVPQSELETAVISQDVFDKLERVGSGVEELAPNVEAVNDALTRHADALGKLSLSECNLGDLPFELALQPPSVNMEVDEPAQFILIKGGKPPYEARTTAGSTSLTIRGPARNEAHFDVSLGSSSVHGRRYQVLVLDSSSPPKSTLLTVIRGEDPTGTAAAPVPPVTRAATKTDETVSRVQVKPSEQRSAVQKSVDSMPSFEMRDGSKISLMAATRQDASGKLTITIGCTRPAPPPSACLKLPELRASVKKTLEGKVDGTILDSASLLTRPATCACT